MPQHVVVGVAEDLLDLQADPLGEPVEIEQKVVKWHAAPEDTRFHIGRPFEKHAELEAVRERQAALEEQMGAAAASDRESGSGPQFDPGAADGGGREMTEAEMVMLGGTAVVVSEPDTAPPVPQETSPLAPEPEPVAASEEPAAPPAPPQPRMQETAPASPEAPQAPAESTVEPGPAPAEKPIGDTDRQPLR
ncbi:hypothetical protein [Streptomyces pseudogriseolus]|uniref:hypothetical protein n=1 Tax=Streptomyces pseudogriseolus TaxID=36817 RepID=UPI003FA1EF40